MRVNEAAVYELALKAVSTGGYAVSRLLGNGKGRPSNNMKVGDTVLNPLEFELYEKLYAFGCQCKGLGGADVLSDEEFATFMKDAAPKLMKRAVDMALVSDDLKAVRQVASDIADRGYGKAASQININLSDKDIRGAWKQLEERKLVMIEGEVVND